MTSNKRVERFREHIPTLLNVYYEGMQDLADALDKAAANGVDLTDDVMHALEHYTRGFASNLVRGQYGRIASIADFSVLNKPHIQWTHWVPAKPAKPGEALCAVEPVKAPVADETPVSNSATHVAKKRYRDFLKDDPEVVDWDDMTVAELLVQKHPKSSRLLITPQMLFTLGAAIEYLRHVAGYEDDDPDAFVLAEGLAREYTELTPKGVASSLSALVRYGVMEKKYADKDMGCSDKEVIYCLTKRSYDVFAYATTHESIPSWHTIRKEICSRKG